jgi:hypothetical protein
MSLENAEIARRAVEQWRRGGATLDALPVEVYAEDVEWDQSAVAQLDGPARGRGLDDLREIVENWLSGWTTYEVEPKEFIDAGENVSTSFTKGDRRRRRARRARPLSGLDVSRRSGREVASLRNARAGPQSHRTCPLEPHAIPHTRVRCAARPRHRNARYSAAEAPPRSTSSQCSFPMRLSRKGSDGRAARFRGNGSGGTGACAQAPAACRVWRWSLSRLWVAAIRRHSERAAARPLRLKRSMRRLVLIWANTGSTIHCLCV